MPTNSDSKAYRLATVSLLGGLLLLALGYWGAWLPHSVAGLNILGIDLAEYVKFVPEVQSGQIQIWRLVFYLPLITLSFGLTLLASIRHRTFPAWVRAFLVILAIPCALAMLPPAWTPALLRTPEFRTQTLWLCGLALLALLSPLLRRLLPDALRGLLLAVLAVLPFPALAAFVRLRPALETLYRHPASLGWAWYVAGAGALLVGAGGMTLLVQAWRQRRHASSIPG